MKRFGLLANIAISALATGIMASGGRAGYDPQNPNTMVPITDRNIGRDILKPSRNSKNYRRFAGQDCNRIGSREQKRFARNLALGRYRFFDHAANRARIFDAATERQIDRYRDAMGEPTPELTIADYDDGPVSIQAEIPHPGTPIPAEDFAINDRIETDRDTLRVHEIPEGLKEGDIEALKLFVTEGVLRAGVRRDRLRDAGFVNYDPKAREWYPTCKGSESVNDRRR